MGLLFFSFAIDICAFDGIGEVKDGMHLRSGVLGERGKGKKRSRNSGMELHE